MFSRTIILTSHDDSVKVFFIITVMICASKAGVSADHDIVAKVMKLARGLASTMRKKCYQGDDQRCASKADM